MKPTDFAKGIGDFLSKYLPAERRASSNTISSYKDTFILFIGFMEQEKRINAARLFLKHFTQVCIIEFLDWLQKQRHSSDSTRNVRLAALHSFCRYLQYENPEYMEEWQRIMNIKIKITETGTVNYLSLEGIKLLLEQPDTSTRKGLRDLSLFALMYDCGARVQEILDLTPSAIRLDKPYTIKLIGKGRKARIVPLMEQQVIHLKHYMTSNSLQDNNMNLHPLFFNSRKEKLTRAGVHYLLQAYAAMARNKNQPLIPDRISCHSLRHSKAMHLLQAGVHLIYIRDILGHTSVLTTEIYARVDSKQKREAIEHVYQDLIAKEQPTWSQNQDLIEWLKGFN
ncbi:site-specific integrase [Pedobacter sp.]|jgi:integrase/recombinase XerD|uniref:site-specific integrase n=1 Tax=Pedobacter sp. TaxID=1411316 RepID=UPI002CDEA0D1|nr:site-specific integrase [Pedobacter sp.]HWW42442.1 site-specific integrase [Pedobacter sp.]